MTRYKAWSTAGLRMADPAGGAATRAQAHARADDSASIIKFHRTQCGCKRRPCHVLPEVSEDGGTAAGPEGISQITEADAVIRHPGSMKAKK